MYFRAFVASPIFEFMSFGSSFSVTRPLKVTGFAPLWSLLGLAGLAVFARFALQRNLPLPQCWLRKLTGIPCPSCGCTRSLAAWMDGDLVQAFQFNPLFFLFCITVLAWLALWTVEALTGRAVLVHLRARLGRWPLWKAAVGLLALNWLYLCLALPK